MWHVLNTFFEPCLRRTRNSDSPERFSIFWKLQNENVVQKNWHRDICTSRPLERHHPGRTSGPLQVVVETRKEGPTVVVGMVYYWWFSQRSVTGDRGTPRCTGVNSWWILKGSLWRNEEIEIIVGFFNVCSKNLVVLMRRIKMYDLSTNKNTPENVNIRLSWWNCFSLQRTDRVAVDRRRYLRRVLGFRSDYNGSTWTPRKSHR